MARIIAVLFLLILNSFAFQAIGQQDSLVSQFWGRNPNTDTESTTSNQVQIITADQILYSGYTLVSDALQLIDGWTMTTYNGDKWNLQSNAAGNYQSQNWILMLDGARIELSQLDAKQLNTLGISARDIERIEVVNVAGNYLGEWNDKGIIHIITKRNKEGFTYRGFVGNGNEIGDPHLQVNSNTSLNVHGYGSSMSNFIGYKRKRLSIQLNQYYNDYFYRDTSALMWPLINRYNKNPDFVNQLRNGRLQIAYTGKRATHQFALIGNRGDDVILPSGFLAPHVVHNQFYIGTYNFRYVFAKGVLHYRSAFTQRKVNGGIDSSLSYNQTYLTQNLNYTLSKNNSSGTRIAQFGIAIEYIGTSLKSRFPSANIIIPIFNPYFSYTYPITKKSKIFTDISILAASQITPKVVLGYYKQPTIISNWSVVGSFSKRCLRESNDYFQFISLNSIPNSPSENQVSSLASFDYFFNVNVNRYFKVSFNSGVKYLMDELYFIPNQSFSNINPVLIGRNDIITKDQMRWLNRINVHYDMLKNTRFDFNYMRIRSFNENEQQNTIPKNRISLVITQTLPSRIYIWVRYYHQSATSWINPDYLLIPPSTLITNQFTRIQSMHTFDAGITKKLMKEYLIFNLSLRNVFNTTERYQATGATFYLRLFASINLNIDGVFAKSTSKP